jgi:hypothetical protein
MSRFRKILSQYLRLLAYVKPYRGRLAGGIAFGLLYGPINAGVLSVVKHVWARVFEQTTDTLTLW